MAVYVNIPATSGGAGTITTASPLSGDGSVGNPATIAAGALTRASLANDTNLNPIAYAVNRLKTLAGLTYSSCAIDSSDFVETVASNTANWTVSPGTATTPTNRKGGIVQTTTSTQFYRPASWARIARATEKFGFRCRFRLTSGAVAGAGSLMRTGLIDNATAAGFYWGAAGSNFNSLNTAKYWAASNNGTTATSVVSTVSIDTGWHVGDLWCDGTNFWFAVDEEAAIQMTGTLPASTFYLQPFFQGTDNACEWDYFVAISGQE